MKQMSMKPDSHIHPGTTITGKWHKNTYKIEQQIGAGAIGIVFLTRMSNKPAALKISEKSASLTVEVNVLEALAKVQGNRLGPSLLEVDDWQAPNGKTYIFYVMEYIQGEPVHRFIHNRGVEWIGVFLMQMLTDLEILHQAGWVFGDLKTDNLLIANSPVRIRWIDVGGTTQMGRAIKEYTEFFDRGYWQMGSRKADPGYDLFALAMVMLHIAYPDRFEKGSDPETTLMTRLQKAHSLKTYQTCLVKALKGHYQTSGEMKRDVAAVIGRKQTDSAYFTRPQDHSSRRHLLIESGSIGLIAALYYLTSLLLP